MSFDANIGRSQPIIKAAANMNNDGGSGGNTGFMMRGRRKKVKDDHISIFEEEPALDSFEMLSKLPKRDSSGYKNSWFENMVEKFIK
ncbi:MAG: hypothetical protein ACI37Q_07525 [Candidatus Gastranaerophilaceae bacterium]